MIKGNRAAAKKVGLSLYYTGKACKRGHVAARITSNGRCVECSKADTNNWHKTQRSTDPKWAEHRRELASDYKRRRPDAVAKHRQRRKELTVAQKCSCCTLAEINSHIQTVRDAGLEADHTRPLGLGGLHCVHNIQAMSQLEHQLKSAREYHLIRAAGKV